MAFSRLFRPARLLAAYDAAAENWQNGIERLGYLGAYAALFAAFPPQEHGSVLDVGTGTGAFSQACLQHCVPKQLVLIDPSEEMLVRASMQLARHAPENHAVGIGAELEESPFDTVLCAHVLEHIDDPQAAAHWLFRQTGEGGRLYLSVSQPHWCTALLRWKWGHRAFSPTEMQALLLKAGFSRVATFRFPSGPPSRTSMGYVAFRS